MVSTIRRYELTDAEWERLKPYIPEEQETGSRGRPSKDSRTMLNGICWILRSGAAWRDLPERYGPWQTVYKRFVKWSKAGIFEKIRDNCQAFNPTEHAQLMEPGDMGKNVGIRLVYGMASNISYQNLLGMNVLTMRI